MKKSMRENKNQIAFVVVCLILALLSFEILANIFSIPQNGKQTISVQLYVIPKYAMLVNFTLEIPRVNISSPEVQTRFYNITKRPHSGLNQVVTINFNVPFNESEPIALNLEEIVPINGWAAEHNIYNNIYSNETTSWTIKTYFSSFVAVYTVRSRWLFDTGEIPIFRDAYHFHGSDEPNHYSTGRVSQLVSAMIGFFSLGVFGLLLMLRKPWRKTILRYYPWLTILMTETMVIMFVFVGTPAEIQTHFGYISPFISYFPHFDSSHLILNITTGFITICLLESWIGWGLEKAAEIRLKIMGFVVFFQALFWLMGIKGMGASFVNEALGALLCVYIVLFRRELASTRSRMFMFPILSFFAGYALFRYVIDWFIAGYVFGTEIGEAILHLYAFAIGFLFSVLSFLPARKLLHIHKRTNLEEEG